LENNFKAGDRVVCVNPKGMPLLTKDKVYTILYIRENHLIVEKSDYGYVPQRFISIAEERRKKLKYLFKD